MSALKTVAVEILLLSMALPCAMGANTPANGEREDYRWFSMPIELSKLSPDSQDVPVRVLVDFSDMVSKLGASGVVDEHSLRLYRLLENGQAKEQPVQFMCDPQPRLAQPLKSSDMPAGETPRGVKVAGELTWLASGDKRGDARYRLDFGICKGGVVVQAPFPPQNLRVFDGAGRATPVHYFPRMQIRPDRPMHDQLDLFDSNHLVTSYHLGPASELLDKPAFRRPFLYPLIGPEDVPLTDFGKPHDPTASHAHHYALWIAHTSVGGADFWGEKSGLIVGDKFEQSESGPVFCRIVQNLRWVSSGKDIMHERRQLEVYSASGSDRILDFDLEFKPAGTQAVDLGKTTFGFLAVRVAQSMTVFDGGGEIRNSHGDRNERGAHLKHADWLDQSGPISPDKWAGIAMFDHPDNPRHPTVWHCRNDGWACASFNAPGAYTIEGGKTLRLRYRLLVHGGNAEQGEVARRYAEYAAAPVVQPGAATARNK